MTTFNSNPFYRGRRRVRHKKAIIESGNDILQISRKLETEVSETGDINTTETIQSVVIGNEKITSHLQIQGTCSKCNNWVTSNSIRYCFCGRILCVSCSKWWEDGEKGRPVCPQCYKKLRLSKFWGVLKSIFISPFIEEVGK